ncbi:YceI family protein [Spirosoma arcticum]
MEQTTIEQTRWAIDKAHTSIRFTISHFMIAKVAGHFSEFTGTLTAPTEGFDGANIDLTIQASSISTNDEARDKHLRTPDFFDVGNHPDIRFYSTAFRLTGVDQFAIDGLLTVNGIEKSIMLNATYAGQFEHPVYKKNIAVFETSADIRRLDFNIGTSYPAAALGEVVKLTGTLELARQ